MTAIANSLEGTIGGIDNIIEGVTDSKKVSSVLCTSIIQTKDNSKGKWKFKGKTKGSDKKLVTGGSKGKGKNKNKPYHKAKANSTKDDKKDFSKGKDFKEESCKSKQFTELVLSSSHLSCEGCGHEIDSSFSCFPPDAASPQVFHVNQWYSM